MKKVISFILFLFLSIFSFAQFSDASFDVVILKNNSQFKGQIIEYEIGSHVTIQTNIELPLRFPLSEVLRVIQASDIEIVKDNIPFNNEKLYFHVELATVVSSEGDFGYDLSFSAIQQIKGYLGFGAGIAYVDYGDQYQNFERLALYGSYRTFLSNRQNTSYFQLNAGYAFSINNEENQTKYNSGLLLNPQFGIRFGTSQLMYTIHIGAHIHKTETDRFENPWGSWQQKLTLKRTELGFGLLF